MDISVNSPLDQNPSKSGGFSIYMYCFLIDYCTVNINDNRDMVLITAFILNVLLEFCIRNCHAKMFCLLLITISSKPFWVRKCASLSNDAAF